MLNRGEWNALSLSPPRADSPISPAVNNRLGRHKRNIHPTDQGPAHSTRRAYQSAVRHDVPSASGALAFLYIFFFGPD